MLVLPAVVPLVVPVVPEVVALVVPDVLPLVLPEVVLGAGSSSPARALTSATDEQSSAPRRSEFHLHFIKNRKWQKHAIVPGRNHGAGGAGSQSQSTSRWAGGTR
jgi:hypothetical protein